MWLKSIVSGFFMCCIGSCFFYLSTKAQAPVSNENFTVKEGLSENVVHCILQDKKGFLWIGTHEGLNRYDGYSFKKFLHNRDDSSSLPNSPVERLYENEKGDFLVQTTSRLVKMDRQTGAFFSQKDTLPDFITPINRSISPGHIFSFLNFGIDPYWIYNLESDPKKALRSTLKKDLAAHASSLAFYYDAFKRLWILEHNRLLAIDEQGNTSTVLTGFYINDKDKKSPSWFIDDFNGNLWLRIPGKIFCIDKRKAELKAVVEQIQLGMAVENINTVLLDRSGVLWIGSFYGLKKVNLSGQKFRNIVQGESGKGLVSNFVLGLNIYSGNRLNVQHYFLDPFYSEIELPFLTTRRHRIEEKTIRKLLEELVIRRTGMANSSRRNDQIQKLKDLKYDWKAFRYAYTDRDGIIWSYNNHGKLINYQDERFVNISGSSVEYLWDDNKFLWIATSKQGLIRFNKSTQEVKNYKTDKSLSSSISTNELLCLFPDERENLWIGTRGGGLNYFDKGKETFTTYTQANGLGNNTIYCMVMDDEGNLWMGTANGLSYLNTRSKTFQNFYTSDGLINTEFNRWSAVKDIQGNLYFGGMHGIDYFKPGEVLFQQNNDPTIQFTDFKTGNDSRILHRSTVLNHKQNYVSFEFAAMDFRNPSAAQYKYMLEGSNSDWIDNGYDHTATFAALPPGNYVFRVKGTTQNGVWSNEAIFPFTIKAPWWQTKWFYALCGLLIAAALYSLYRFRMNQLRKLYTVRSKISQDLHDEVGATLSSIHVYSSVASKAMNADQTKAQDALNQINVNTRQVMENMNDIVWAMHTGNKGEISFENKLKNYSYELLAPLNIACSYHIDKNAEKQMTSIEARKNILLIAKEAINNISKHSKATEASVHLITNGKNLQLDIIDNGKGLDAENKRNGNGLQNMKSRVQVLKGDIQFVNGTKTGTHIRCIIPITNIRD